MKTFPITLRFRKPDGSLGDYRVTALRTQHGPIVAEKDGRLVAEALMWRPIPALEQSWLRTKAKTLPAYLKVAALRANSSNDTIYADAGGHIAYLHPQFVPVRSDRFDYRQPFAQAIVADGQTLWLHDIDLNQVTARSQSAVLASTPAALVASAADLASLQRDFELRNAPDRDGLEWVQATPKNRDGQVASVLVGLRGNALAALEILDSFGQRSVLQFSKVEINPQLPAASFSFKPPAGADVIRQ